MSRELYWWWDCFACTFTFSHSLVLLASDLTDSHETLPSLYVRRNKTKTVSWESWLKLNSLFWLMICCYHHQRKRWFLNPLFFHHIPLLIFKMLPSVGVILLNRLGTVWKNWNQNYRHTQRTAWCLQDVHLTSLKFNVNSSKTTYTLATALLSRLNIIAGTKRLTKKPWICSVNIWLVNSHFTAHREASTDCRIFFLLRTSKYLELDFSIFTVFCRITH